MLQSQNALTFPVPTILFPVTLAILTHCYLLYLIPHLGWPNLQNRMLGNRALQPCWARCLGA